MKTNHLNENQVLQRNIQYYRIKTKEIIVSIIEHVLNGSGFFDILAFKHNTEINVANIAKNKCTMVIDNSFDIIHLFNEADEILTSFV